MSVTAFRILCFCLVPVGIYLLVQTIRMLRKTFSGQVLAEVPLSQEAATFSIPATGTYALWLNAELLSRFPGQYRFNISHEIGGQQVPLHTSVFNPHVNGFKTGRMELYKFSAQSGSYRLSVDKTTGNTNAITAALNWLAGQPADAGRYAIQVRESQPTYKMFLSIPMFTLSLGCIIGGFVLGCLAPQVAPVLFSH